MSTSNTSPILPSTAEHDRGAVRAPGDIVVHSCVHRGEHTVEVHLTGEIDHFTARPLRSLLTSAAAAGRTELVLDASRVSFCDSGLLHVLEWWSLRGRRLHLGRRSPSVERLLHAAAAAARPEGAA